MANSALRHAKNAPGSLYVDSTCIDCATCFHLAPSIFKEIDDTSIVHKQPMSSSEWQQAKRAMVSCPTNSIGVESPTELFKEATLNLPFPIDTNVFYCGYTSRSSYGASSYFIRREQGNVLIDSPRFHPQLIKYFEQWGGIKYMFLSHQDDVADHALFAHHFNCQRIIHKNDLQECTREVEIVLDKDHDVDLADDLKIIFTPGHTAGHLCLLYRNKFLFSGDHLFYSRSEDKVYASQNFNWYSWEEQLHSISKLLNFNFSWVLPGHGGWVNKCSNDLKEDLKNIINGGQ
jgi:glyoxylase-like metal-dependent hydrolase (beta-lactamase superfamily II)/ferredoxin